MDLQFVGVMPVAKGGYRWEKVGKDYHLEPVVRPDTMLQYNAFGDEADAMFMELARLGDEDPIRLDAVREFANMYGNFTASFTEWKRQIQAMRECIDLWNEGPKSRLVGPPSDQDLWNRLLMAHKLEPADGWVAAPEEDVEGIDFLLRDAAYAFQETTLVFRKGYRETKGRQRAKVVPSALYIQCMTLRQVFYAQLIEAVLNDYEFDDCQMCGRPMRAKKRRQFCSQSCRVKKYNVRKADALEMFYDGATVKQIAKKLKVDEDVVAGWTTTNQEAT